MFQAGEVLHGRYRIERAIGAGGMGLVYRVVDLRDDSRVALKLLNDAALESPGVVSRFHREAKVLQRLAHPNVIDVRDVGELEGGIPFYVMELLEGRDLRSEQRARGTIPEPEAAGYALQAALALEVVHAAGIIHRDLKPQNLFITNLSGDRQVKLIDFGVSKLVEESEATLTATAAVLGTPHYMSPEQIHAAKHVDGRADIWALGVILYLLVTGRLPFARASLPAIIAAIPNDPPTPYTDLDAHISPQFRALIAKCLEKNPDDRFQSASEVVAVLRELAPPGGIINSPEIDVPSTVPPIARARYQRSSHHQSRAPESSTAISSVGPLELEPPTPGFPAPKRPALLSDRPPREETSPSTRRAQIEQIEQQSHRLVVQRRLLVGAAAMVGGLLVLIFLLRRGTESPIVAAAAPEGPVAALPVPAVVAPPPSATSVPVPPATASAPVVPPVSSGPATKKPTHSVVSPPKNPGTPLPAPKTGKDGAPLHL